MKLALIALVVATVAAKADVPAVPNSDSPDGKLHAVMDIDRDPRIDPEWKEGSHPKIEITVKATKKALESIEYFGPAGDDARPLREHVSLKWRPDSQAFAITTDDRFYSRTEVYALNQDSKFVSVKLPDYTAMTGFPPPDSKHLRPRGRSTVEGWDEKGRLIYGIFHSPLPSFTGNDPLVHRVFLRVSPTKMVPEKVESEKGVWDHGDWVPAGKTKPVAPDMSKAEQPAPKDMTEYERGVAAATEDLAKNGFDPVRKIAEELRKAE